MKWEHTHLTMAPRAGRIDELRDEADSYRRTRPVLRERRARRARALRAHLVRGLGRVLDLATHHRLPRDRAIPTVPRHDRRLGKAA